MKLFISHAIKDVELLQKLKENLEPYNIELLIAEHFEDLENNITEKIKNLIDSCDAGLIILTENGFNSNFVQQEIGYIIKANKPYIQLIQKGIKTDGFNYGKGGIELDPENTEIALKKTRNILIKFWDKKRKEIVHEKREIMKKTMVRTQKKKEEKQLNIGLGLGIGFLIAVIFLGD